MKILFIGEFSSFHKYLAEGLRLCYNNTEISIASNGDGWKHIPGATIALPSLNSKNLINRFYYMKEQINFIKNLQKYDIIQLVNPNVFSVPLRGYFYKIIREKSKCLSLAACGINYREFQSYLNGKFRYYVYDYDKESIRMYQAKKMLTKIRISNELWLEKHVDVIIPCAYEYSVGYTGSNAYPAIPLPVNTDEIQYSPNLIQDKEDKGDKGNRQSRQGKIVFFHGLNREAAKGTPFIREAMERLQKNYPNDVEIILEGHMPYEKYVQLMKKTNVVLDQCVGSAYGINGCIAMAQGKVLMAGNTPEMRKTLKFDYCPVIHIEPDVEQIYSQLEWVVKNKEQIPELGKKSREFVEKYHNYKLIAQQYMSAWKSTGKLDDVK